MSNLQAGSKFCIQPPTLLGKNKFSNNNIESEFVQVFFHENSIQKSDKKCRNKMYHIFNSLKFTRFFHHISLKKKKKTDSAYDIRSIFVSILCYPNGRTQIMLALLVPLVSTLFGSFSLLVIHFQVLHQRLQTLHAIHTYNNNKNNTKLQTGPVIIIKFW